MNSILYVEKIGKLIWDDMGYGYDYFFKIHMELWGESVDVEIIFASYEKESISDKQILDYTYFIENQVQILENVSVCLLKYYQEKYDELKLGDLGFNKITSTNELKNIVYTDFSVYIESEDYDYIGLAFACTWEEEHGIGLKVINGEVAEIGFQDIIL